MDKTIDSLIAECSKDDAVKVVLLRDAEPGYYGVRLYRWYVINRLGYCTFTRKSDAEKYAAKLRCKGD